MEGKVVKNGHMFQPIDQDDFFLVMRVTCLIARNYAVYDNALLVHEATKQT